jgi:hypothetical protein
MSGWHFADLRFTVSRLHSSRHSVNHNESTEALYQPHKFGFQQRVSLECALSSMFRCPNLICSNRGRTEWGLDLVLTSLGILEWREIHYGIEREVFLIQSFLANPRHKFPTNESDTPFIRRYRLTHVICLVCLTVLAMHVPPEPTELPQQLFMALTRHQNLPTLEDRLFHHHLSRQGTQLPPWLLVPPSSNAVALSGKR